jgi:hypothetical protein
VTAFRRQDGQRWTLADADGDEAALILPVVREAIEHSRRRPTSAEAEWIARISRACPDLRDAKTVQYRALVAQQGGADLDRVEALLAFAPWRDAGVALLDAYGSGRVGFDVVFLAGYENEAPAARRPYEEQEARGNEQPKRRVD